MHSQEHQDNPKYWPIIPHYEIIPLSIHIYSILLSISCAVSLIALASGRWSRGASEPLSLTTFCRDQGLSASSIGRGRSCRSSWSRSLDSLAWTWGMCAWSLEACLNKSIVTYVWPFIRSRGSVELEDLEDLVNLWVTIEQGLLLDKLCKDASHSPGIDAQRVLLLA